MSNQENANTEHYGTIEERRDVFIKTFVTEFELKLEAYYSILYGEVEKGSGSRSRTEVTAGYAGDVISGIAGFLLIPTGSTLWTKGMSWAGKKFNHIMNKEKRENIAKELLDLKSENMNLRTVLIEIAYDVFRSFERQFCKANYNDYWKKGIEKVAKDAVYRSMNYCGELYKKGNGNPKNFKDVIFQGVIFGKSKGNTKFKIKYESDECRTTDLYESTGVILTETETLKYFERKGRKKDTFGYRRLLSTENWHQIKDQYKPSQGDISQEYDYKFGPITVEMVERFVKEIKTDANNLTKEELNEILNDVKNEILIQIKIYAEKNSKAFESFEALLGEIRHSLNNINGDEYQEILKRITEISKSNSRTGKLIFNIGIVLVAILVIVISVIVYQLKHHEENKASHNKTQEKVNEIINILGNRLDSNETVWFNVENPIDLYSGREKELIELHDKIQRPTPQSISKTVITGLGGMGKTQLAKRYVKKYAKDLYSNIIWINSESEAEIIESFSSLATNLKIKKMDVNNEIKDMKTILKEVYQVLEKRDTFLVFDDVESNEILKIFLPRKSSDKALHILITSRYQEWGKNIAVLSLNELSMTDGIKLVKKGLTLDDDDAPSEDIEMLLTTLQNFPLCIVQAIAYIEDQNVDNRFTIKDYLNEFERNSKKLLESELFKSWVEDDMYKKTTYTTWEITTKKIANDSLYGATALDILNVMSFLASENIIRDGFLPIVKSEAHLKEATRLLIKYSMVSRNKRKNILSVHKLVQDVTREHIPKDLIEEIIANTYESLSIYRLKEGEMNDEVRESLSHFVSLVKHINSTINGYINGYVNSINGLLYPKKKTLDIFFTTVLFMTNTYLVLGNPWRVIEIFPDILIKMAIYDPNNYSKPYFFLNFGYAKGKLGERETEVHWLKEALSIQENSYGPNYYELATTMHDLAIAYGKLGEIEKEKDMLEKALIIKENYYGPNRYELTATVQALGVVYGDLGETEKGKEFLERALKFQEMRYGSNDYTLAVTMQNLGVIYGKLGEREKAMESLEKAYVILEKHYGPNHFELAATMENLAAAYGKLGEVEKEKDMLEKALIIKENHYSPNHYEIAATMQNLGIVCGKLGEIEKKKEWLEKAFIILEKKYGPYRFEYATIMKNLGEAYGELGETEKEKKSLEKPFGVQENRYGQNHETATTMPELVIIYEKLGEMEKPIIIKENHLRRNFYRLAKTIQNLGIAYRKLDQTEKESELLEKAVMILEKHLGPNPVDLEKTMQSLCGAYGHLGDIEKEKEFLEKALIIRESHYGPNHYELAITMQNLGVIYGILGQIEKEKELLEQALSIQENSYDPNHYRLATTMHNLAIVHGKLGETEKEKALLEKALTIQESLYGPNHHELAVTMQSLGVVYEELGQIEKGKELLEKASSITKNSATIRIIINWPQQQARRLQKFREGQKIFLIL